MDIGIITLNGETLTTTQTGTFTWTAEGTTITITPMATWRVTRNDTTVHGETAQQALDNLIAAEAKAARRAARTAKLTPGQLFARTMREYLGIGTRTRTRRLGLNLHDEILEAVQRASYEAGYHTPDRQAIFGTASSACRSYEKHIRGYRAHGNVIAHINQLSPWQFCALLGEMVDADITNVGEGERWFADLARSLYTQAA
jgi:hypothetical protein